MCFPVTIRQEYIPLNTGYGFEQTTTTELGSLTKKAEGDFFYDYTIKSHVYWDGSTFKLFSTKNYIDVQSPRTPFDFAFGTWDELEALTFDNNTVLIPTNDNGDFVTTDGFVDGLSFSLVGSDLVLTATRNGLSNVVSNTIDISGTGITQVEGDARYFQLSDYDSDAYTPTITDAGGGATYSATTTSGNYVKVGDQVTVSIFFNVISTTGTPSGELRVSLPFSPIIQQGLNVSTFFGGNRSFYTIVAETHTSSSYLVFKYKNALNANLATSMDSVSFSGGTIAITGTYITSE